MAKQTYRRLKSIVAGAHPGAEGHGPASAGELTQLEKFTHFWVYVVQGFERSRCFVRASALSFSSLLALIPMLAVAIGVTSSILKSKGEDDIYKAVDKFVGVIVPSVSTNHVRHESDATHSPPEATLLSTNAPAGSSTNFNPVGSLTNLAGATNDLAASETAEDARVSAQKAAARSIHSFVQNSSSTTLGVVGMLALIWVAISMLANVESTFNDIWGVTRGRNWFRRIVLYWGALTLGPLAVIGAYSIGGLHAAAARQFIIQLPWIGAVFSHLLTVAALWLVFSLIYLSVPNTKVYWDSAAIGGLAAGLMWHINNELGYLYVSRVVANSRIYGSLFLIPVFMLGLYTSWVILLFGVQLSYTWQNRKSYLQDKFEENVNQRGREFIALRLMTCLGLRYEMGEPPATTQQIATELGISTRLTQKVLQTLLTARLITEVAGEEGGYLPARPLDAITAHQVLLAVRCINKPEVFTRAEPVRDEIYGEFARIEEAERVAATAVTMQALVRRARARLSAPMLVLPETTISPVSMAPLESAETPPVPTVEPPPEPVPPSEPAVNKSEKKFAGPEDDYGFPL